MSDDIQGEISPALPVSSPEATPENVATPADNTQNQPEVKTEANKLPQTQEELDKLIQARIAKAESKSERRYLRMYKETLERLLPQQPKETPPEPNGRPSREKFANDEDWVEAVTDWKLEQRDAKVRNSQQQVQEQSILSKTEKIYAEAQEIPGFDREEFDSLPLTQPIVAALVDSDTPAKLMAYMTANPDEVQRIANLPPARQAAEIGKLEVKMATAPKVSKAPPPLTPVGTKGSSSKDPSDMTDAEFAKWRLAVKKSRG